MLRDMVNKKTSTYSSKFIITDDEYTKNQLLEIGYQLISNKNNIYTFEANPTLNFSSFDDLKIIYTNTLTF